MKNSAKLALIIGIITFFGSCMITGVTGSRKVVTATRNIEQSFTGIKVSQGIEVALTQGEKVSLSVEMDDNLHELLVTKVEDGILQIYFSKNVNRRKESTLYLTMPTIESIQSSSGAVVTGRNTIKTTEITLKASSGSDINLRVQAQTISADSSSGSSIKLVGNSENLLVESSSGSTIQADNLTADNIQAKASSGSDININPLERLTAKASSGATIRYQNEPNEKDISKSSGGSVSGR